MLGFHSFYATYNTIVGIVLLRMIKKRQRAGFKGETQSAAKQFYTLAS